MKVLGVKWFCGTSNIGIVRVQTPDEGIRYFIGTCDGLNEAYDANYIAQTGSAFPDPVGDMLFRVPATSQQ